MSPSPAGWWAAGVLPPDAPAPRDVAAVRTLRPTRPARLDASLTVFAPDGVALPSTAVDGRLAVICEGTIHEPADRARALGLPDASSPATLVLAAYARHGASSFARALAGEFAAVIWDAEARDVVALRDPLGMTPLYCAAAAGTLLFSTSAPALLSWPGVRQDLDPIVLAEYLQRQYRSHEDTAYADVRRVPAGSVFQGREDRTTGTSVRYWDPAPPDGPIDWLESSEIGRFDGVFTRAVTRAMTGSRRTGVFLSGGLDSIAVTALATELAVRTGRPKPFALSLEFPPPSDEAVTQRGVAAGLGLDHACVPLEDSVGRTGLVAGALSMGASWPVPMLTVWNPAYAHLARAGQAGGCDTILTGRGGDEALSLSPLYAADLLRRGDLVGLARLLVGFHRSYSATRVAVLRRGLLTWGLRPIAADAAARLAPDRWRRHHLRRTRDARPGWLAPGADLRRQLDARALAQLEPDPAGQGHYVRQMRRGLLHPLVAYDLEESFELGRQLGVRIRHPFWDADLLGFLCRVPPRLLSERRAKWLVRDTLARRFPDLGLERQRKVLATDYFRSLLAREAPAAWRALGGTPALADLGVVDSAALDAAMPALLSASRITDLARVWEIMNLETWVRCRRSNPLHGGLHARQVE